jgi:hypothetical protein
MDGMGLLTRLKSPADRSPLPRRTMKQLLDAIEQARAGEFAEASPLRPAQPQNFPRMQQSASSSLDASRRKSSVGPSGTLQAMPASQGLQSAGQGPGSLGSISMSNGNGGVPSWMGTPSAAGTSSLGPPSPSAGSKATQGKDATLHSVFWCKRNARGRQREVICMCSISPHKRIVLMSEGCQSGS